MRARGERTFSKQRIRSHLRGLILTKLALAAASRSSREGSSTDLDSDVICSGFPCYDYQLCFFTSACEPWRQKKIDRSSYELDRSFQASVPKATFVHGRRSKIGNLFRTIAK